MHEVNIIEVACSVAFVPDRCMPVVWKGPLSHSRLCLLCHALGVHVARFSKQTPLLSASTGSGDAEAAVLARL